MTATAYAHTYRPRGVQEDLFYCREPEVLLSGPAGTGKSRACLEKVHALALRYPGMRALLLRKTHNSLVATGLQTFNSYVISAALADRTVWWYGGSASKPPAYMYTNGSMIMVGGMDNPDKIMSSEYDVIYIQEATELKRAEWEMCTTRLRNGVVPFQQLMADCNPREPTHWLKQRADSGKCLMLDTRHEENPVYFDEDGALTEQGRAYLDRLNQLSGVEYRRLRQGHWAAAEGIIYEHWDNATMLVEPFDIPADWARYWAVDWGMTNPFVWQNWAEDPRDGTGYLVQEVYRTGTIVEDHVKMILGMVNGQKVAPGVVDGQPVPQSIFVDHDLEDRRTFERHSGLPTRAAYKDVLTGIEAVQARIRRRRLRVFKGARVHAGEQGLMDSGKPTCTVEEFPGYVWYEPKQSTPTVNVRKEGPAKENDHGMDAMRYYVAGRDLRGGPRARFLPA